ncbi:hypothetical protein LINGRAHAP2_LOCUS20153 [Linum grandiflorum]
MELLHSPPPHSTLNTPPHLLPFIQRAANFSVFATNDVLNSNNNSSPETNEKLLQKIVKSKPADIVS